MSQRAQLWAPQLTASSVRGKLPLGQGAAGASRPLYCPHAPPPTCPMTSCCLYSLSCSSTAAWRRKVTPQHPHLAAAAACHTSRLRVLITHLCIRGSIVCKWTHLPDFAAKHSTSEHPHGSSAVCKRWKALADDGMFTRVARPCDNLNQVLASARAGDTVFIKAGFYTVGVCLGGLFTDTAADFALLSSLPAQQGCDACFERLTLFGCRPARCSQMSFLIARATTGRAGDAAGDEAAENSGGDARTVGWGEGRPPQPGGAADQKRHGRRRQREA